MKGKIESWMRPYRAHPLAVFIDSALLPVAARSSALFPILSAVMAALVYFLFRGELDGSSPMDLIWLASGAALLLMSALLRLVYHYVGERVPVMVWLWISLLMLMGWAFYWTLPSVLFLRHAAEPSFWLLGLVVLAWAVIAAELLSAFAIHALVFNTLMSGGFALCWLLLGPITPSILVLPLLMLAAIMVSWRTPRRHVAELVARFESEEWQQERDQSRSARARFLSAVSNDLYQPLQAMGLQLGQLPHHVSTVRGRELVGQVDLNRSNMDDVLKSLSDLSRLDRRVVVAKPSHVALGVELADILNHYRRKALTRGLGFSVTSEDDVALTDADVLERVVGYLLCNAVRYTTTGEVKVLFQKGLPGYVQVQISDTGSGVKAEHLGRIFEEFGQLEHEVHSGRQGLGLGLSLVERFCELLDVEIDFRSTPGQGTSVTLLIPQGDPEQVPERPVTSMVQSFDGLEVLLIEPDAEVRKAVAAALSQWGCQVKAAESRWAGLCLLDEGWRPRLVVADNGADDKPMGLAAVVSVWQALNEEIGALIMATHTASLDNETVREAGIQVLKKPASHGDIRQAITQLLPREKDVQEEAAELITLSTPETLATTAVSETPAEALAPVEAPASVGTEAPAPVETETPASVEITTAVDTLAQPAIADAATKPVGDKGPEAELPDTTALDRPAPAAFEQVPDEEPVLIDLNSLKLMGIQPEMQPLKEKR